MFQTFPRRARSLRRRLLPAAGLLGLVTASAVAFAFPEPYPDVQFPNGVEPITRVTFANVDNASSAALNGSPALEDFTTVVAVVAPGETWRISVQGNTGGSYTNYINAFIDWNRNGVFDPGEEVQIGTIQSSNGVDGTKAEADIAVPANAEPGPTRMRVMKKYDSYAGFGNQDGWGQAEDYTIDIGGTPTWTVTPSVNGPGGDISPSEPQRVEDGETTAFTLQPASGYAVAGVGGSCDGTLSGTTFTTAPVAGDCTVEASFVWAAPLATVTPASLAFTVAANATASGTLNIANAPDRDPLSFSIESRDLTRTPLLRPRARAGQPIVGIGTSGLSGGFPEVRPAALRRPDGSYVFQWDDGTWEDTVGLGASGAANGAVWLNRFEALGPLTVDTVSILWPDDPLLPTLSGLVANLVAYFDADADGDPSNAVRLGSDTPVTISTVDLFETYVTNFAVPGAGDVYIGFVDDWALAGGYTPRTYPAAIDQDTSEGMSFVSGSSTPPTDVDNLANNNLTGVIDDFGVAGNWLIRATGVPGAATCTGAVIGWLAAAPASGSVAGGADADITVTVDPAAAGLAVGVHEAELCITTNDLTQPLIRVPVQVSVTSPADDDGIFCNGFEDGEGNTCAS